MVTAISWRTPAGTLTELIEAITHTELVIHTELGDPSEGRTPTLPMPRETETRFDLLYRLAAAGPAPLPARLGDVTDRRHTFQRPHAADRTTTDGQHLLPDGGSVPSDDAAEEPLGEADEAADAGEMAGGSPPAVEADDDRMDEPPAEPAPSQSDAAPGEESAAEPPSLTPSVRQFFRAWRGDECEVCGTSADEATELQIHHRTEQAAGGTDHPENLILLCKTCHGRHHRTLPSAQAAEEAQQRADEATEPIDGDSDTTKAPAGAEPLPPRSEPNGTDGEILSIIEAQGPVPTGVIAEQANISKQYVRRQCWKLSGEQLIAPTTNDTWELCERAADGQITIGLPDNPERAKRAGRDEVIRQLSAHGLAHTEIAEITGLHRSTVDIAVDRARALRIDDGDDSTVDLQAVAMRLSALLDVIDHAQTRQGGDSDAAD